MEQKNFPHLEDTVIPETVERSREWNLDREFGEGTADVMQEFVTRTIHTATGEPLWPKAADAMALGRVLFPEATRWDDRVEKRLSREKGKTLREMEKEVTPNLFANDAIGYLLLTGQRFWHEETDQRMEEALQGIIKSGEGNPEHHVAYRVLFGRSFWNDQEQGAMDGELKRQVESALQDKNFDKATQKAANLRILRAHEIKFIPGKGIEIIDEPPKEFTQKSEPLPEGRRF